MIRPSMIGLGNLKTMYGRGTNKAVFNTAFGTSDNGESSRHENILSGTNENICVFIAVLERWYRLYAQAHRSTACMRACVHERCVRAHAHVFVDEFWDGLLRACM